MDNKVIYIDKKSEETIDKPKINLSKFLTGKNLKILILIIVAIIAMVILMNFNTSNSEKNSLATSSNTYGYKSTLEYCAELESKLQAVLSNVKGAGQVRVMISVDGSPEIVYAKDEDEKSSSNSSGTTTSSNSSSPIIVTVNGSSNPLILTENLPTVKGVIVVSTGASDVGVKLDILNAVSTLLDISIDKISVLKGI
ncbi:MAG: hypothetical protein ACI4PF_01555 [Christensenellales bacterium]